MNGSAPASGLTGQMASSQASGYVTDVRYPAYFYKEIQPLWLATMARLQGVNTPDFSGAFSFCDLGCGTGTNLLVAAACHPAAQFTGVDCNVEHIAVANSAAKAAGLANIRFLHADFNEFNADTTPYDGISCHGVWSWIAEEHREALRQCAANKLKPNGLFALHYMTHPGSAELIPLQHLLRTSAQHAPGTSVQKTITALKLLRLMADRGSFHNQPEMLRHLANWEKREPADLAHEFLTPHWAPQHSTDVHQQMGAAGLSYICSADAFNNLDASLSIPAAMQGLIRQTAAPAMAEMLKDFARNAHQRIDLFQKSPEPMPEAEGAAAIGELTFGLMHDALPRPPYRFETPIGPVDAPEEVVTPLLNALSKGPKTVKGLMGLPEWRITLPELLQLVQLLMSQGFVHPVSADAGTPNVQPLNAWFARQSLNLTVIPQCASAVVNLTPAPPAC